MADVGLRRRAKDIHRCLRNLESFSDRQARVKEWDSDDLSSLVVEITPNDGPYRGSSHCFRITMEGKFPQVPPQVDCESAIYHPNIDHTSDVSNVCLNLFDEWQDTFGLQDCIQGLLFLLLNPNLEDPLSPYFDPAMDEEEFLENVRRSLIGEEVEGVVFTRKDHDCGESGKGDTDSVVEDGQPQQKHVDASLEEELDSLLRDVDEETTPGSEGEDTGVVEETELASSGDHDTQVGSEAGEETPEVANVQKMTPVTELDLPSTEDRAGLAGEDNLQTPKETENTVPVPDEEFKERVPLTFQLFCTCRPVCGNGRLLFECSPVLHLGVLVFNILCNKYLRTVAGSSIKNNSQLR